MNGRVDWHWTKGMGVRYLWPWPWLDLLVTNVRCKLQDSDRDDFRCQGAVNLSSPLGSPWSGSILPATNLYWADRFLFFFIRLIRKFPGWCSCDLYHRQGVGLGWREGAWLSPVSNEEDLGVSVDSKFSYEWHDRSVQGDPWIMCWRSNRWLSGYETKQSKRAWFQYLCTWLLTGCKEVLLLTQSDQSVE